MNKLTEITETGKTALSSFKNIFLYLKQRKFWSAFKEVFVFGKLVYKNNIKGKYITVKGRRIPVIVPIIVAVIALFYIYPSEPENTSEETAITQDDVKEYVYDKNGVRIYDLRKCNNSVCGTIENYGDNFYDHISVIVTFHAPTGEVIYEGGVDAKDVKAKTRIKIEIPTPEPFAYAKFKEALFNQPLPEK